MLKNRYIVKFRAKTAASSTNNNKRNFLYTKIYSRFYTCYTCYPFVVDVYCPISSAFFQQSQSSTPLSTHQRDLELAEEIRHTPQDSFK